MPNASESSSTQDEKIRLLRELSQVQQKAKALERERNNTMFNKKSEFRPFYSELEDINLKFDEQRKEEMNKMKKDLDRLRGVVRTFRSTVLHMRSGVPGAKRETGANDQNTFSPSGAPISVEKLKEKVEEIDSSINSFKSANRENYELFVHAEKSLYHELAALERRIEAWDIQQQQSQSASVVNSRGSPASASGAPGSSGSKVKIYNMTNDLSSTKPPAIIEFEKYLEKHGGERGGWDEYDHVTFVKYYKLLFINSSANEDVSKRRLIERMSLELPYRSVEDISNHVQFYKIYLQLQDNKKVAIANWRKQKQSERIMKANLTEEDSELTEETPTGVELDEEDLLRMEEKREMIKLWRIRKMEEERRLKEEQILREKEQKEKERAYLLRQKEIKEKIDEMKRQKEREDEIARMRNLADQLERDHQRKAQLREKRIQSTKKTLALAEEKRDMKRMEEFALSERSKFLSMKKQAVESNVHRDPSRLLQPTKGWENRLKEKEDGNPVGNSSFAVQKIPQKAVPAWRSNVG